ncbi:GntR family transcriptional regulator [Actinocorallia sp. A-T 12471]|uniref:GntR family transcriptional regulator n=1 Tax=Actinocorallia sp. A-T 12471 TaxID=3089813 RepID=UPI0029CE7DD3|nr:GntR family transcriptional regulator [Actinocorallia sp. A-T 12471]MDX6740654.1 GntR family transcriptional regulator [Actinocorallia sp. A-T 12471]
MSTTPSEAQTASTLAERTYHAVRGLIGSGELAPGVKVTERGLAELMGVSATPVREAIRRLELDGLIERLGPRTLVVARLYPDSVRELAEVEAALRGLAARFAARHATAADLDALDALLDEADDLVILIQRRRQEGEPVTRYVERILDVLARFNDGVNAAARNPVLVRLLAQTRSFSPGEQRELTTRAAEADPDFAADRYTGHRALVRALRAGDAPEAERIATAHTAQALLDLRHPNP